MSRRREKRCEDRGARWRQRFRSRRRAILRCKATRSGCGAATPRQWPSNCARRDANRGQDARGKHDASLRLSLLASAKPSRRRTILCPAPALARSTSRKLLAPHLSDRAGGVPAARGLGSSIFAQATHLRPQSQERAASAETGTVTLADPPARPVRSGHHDRAKRLPVGVLSAETCRSCHRHDRTRCPRRDRTCGDALSGALMNADRSSIPPLIVMNAGPLGAFRSLGHPQGRHAGLDPPRHRTRSTPNASRCAKVRYGAPHSARQSLCEERARNGCMAAARMTA